MHLVLKSELDAYGTARSADQVYLVSHNQDWKDDN